MFRINLVNKKIIANFDKEKYRFIFEGLNKIKVSKTILETKHSHNNISIHCIFFILLCLFFLLSSCHTSHKSSGKDSERKENALPSYHVDGKNKRGKKVVKEAMEWLGTPYKYGGAEKGKGSDCSGLVMSAYLEATGLKLPRNSAKQAEFCKKISGDDLEIGDLCFFATGKDPNRISHVGIMIDNESFIHASSSKGVVISKITTPYYTRTLIQFGRVPD